MFSLLSLFFLFVWDVLGYVRSPRSEVLGLRIKAGDTVDLTG